MVLRRLQTITDKLSCIVQNPPGSLLRAISTAASLRARRTKIRDCILGRDCTNSNDFLGA